MKRAFLISLLLVASCGKKKPEDNRPKGKLCFAANTAEMFKWTKPDTQEAVDFTQGRQLAIKFRGKAIDIPNEQRAFDDAREGEPVAVTRGDTLLESWKVNWKMGTDLCYYFRPFDPAKPERSPKFILNTNQADDRCTCW